MHRLLIAIPLCSLMFSAAANAGVVVTSTQTRLADHRSMAVTLYLDADRMKVTLPGMVVIYRSDLNRVWAADLRRHVYYELTPETVRQFTGISAQLNAAQAQLQGTLAQLPPEQRAQIESLLGSIAGPPPARNAAARPVFAKLGGSKTVAGYSCDLYRKTADGQQQADFCIAPASSTGLDPADFQVLDRFSDFAAPVMASHLVPHLDDMDWGGMNKAIGFTGIPLDVVAYDHGKPDMQQTVTGIQRVAIPPDTFDLPAGLTKQDFTGVH
jgi:hypothetical protein